MRSTPCVASSGDVPSMALVHQLQADIGLLWQAVTTCRKEVAGLAQQLVDQRVVQPTSEAKLVRRRQDLPVISSPSGDDGVAVASLVKASAMGQVGDPNQATQSFTGFSQNVSPPPGFSYADARVDAQRKNNASGADAKTAQIVDTEREDDGRERHQFASRQIRSSSFSGGTSPAGIIAPLKQRLAGGGHAHIYLCGGSTLASAAGQDDGTVSSLWPKLRERDTWCLETCERMDPTVGVWEAMPNMLRARAAATIVAVGADIYICGGCLAPDGEPLRLVDRFDTTTNIWWAEPPMLSARLGAAAGAIGGVVYICGGCGEGGDVQCTSERFCPGHGCWESFPVLREHRAAPTGGVLSGHLYVCGGRGEDLNSLRTVEVLGLDATGSPCWERAPAMAWPRAAAAAAVVGQRLFVCGGWDGTSPLNTVEAFFADAAAWETVPSMSVKRLGAAAAAAGGCLFVFGGNDNGQLLCSSECFDGSDWFRWNPLTQRRALTTAVSLSMS
eukprot:TRINITY_DN15038_c0_g1_i1.p1 TRINITY_DN15038_c0_g1~~TRINITY_DN15038_c0_g1_i1.p1  ORF type:complete len:501 (-),score=79.70 TRINITY_DN15038_c0_g1_i1:509-2011(-)